MKVKINIGFKRFNNTRFKDMETAILWVRKKKISNVQLKQGGNEWDNF